MTHNCSIIGAPYEATTLNFTPLQPFPFRNNLFAFPPHYSTADRTRLGTQAVNDERVAFSAPIIEADDTPHFVCLPRYL